MTVFAGVNQPQGKRGSMSAAELFARLSSPVVVPRAHLKTKPNRTFEKPDGLLCWSPATFRGDYRKLTNVEAVHAIGLDYDAGTLDVEAARELFADVAGYVHTSFNHRRDQPRLRVIVLLDRCVDAREYKRLWSTLAARASGKHDKSASDASRLWFLPAVPEGDDYRCELLPGAPLDVDAMLATVPEPTVQAEPIGNDAPDKQAPPTRSEWPPVPARRRRYQKYLRAIGNDGYKKTKDAAIAGVRGLVVPPDEVLQDLLEWDRDNDPRWGELALRRKVQWAVDECRVPYGFMLGQRAGAPAITSRADATALIERIAGAVEAMPTAGRSADSVQSVMRTLVGIARPIGSVDVGLAQRPGGERGKINRKTFGAGAKVAVEQGMLRPIRPKPGTQPDTSTWQLRPPEEWRVASCNQSRRDTAGIGTGDNSQQLAAALDSELFRRSFGGTRGFGPKARTMLAALLAGPAVSGPRDAVRELTPLYGWAPSTAMRVQRQLEVRGLVRGYVPIGGLDEIVRRLQVLERQTGLADATARQRAVHQLQREGRAAMQLLTAGELSLALDRMGGTATVDQLKADLGRPFSVVLDGLKVLRAAGRVRCRRRRRGRFEWELIGERVESKPVAGATTYTIRRSGVGSKRQAMTDSEPPVAAAGGG